MKAMIMGVVMVLLQTCSDEETPLEKFLKSETPSFYAEISGEVPVAELGETINLVQGENASLLSSHSIGVNQTMSSFTSWGYYDENGKAITIASPVFEYNNEISIIETFGVGNKIFDGTSGGYVFNTYRNFTLQFSAEDSNRDIKNGKVEVLKYKRVPTNEPPNTGGYEEYIYVWLTIECDLYDTNGVKVGRLTHGRALCVFPAY